MEEGRADDPIKLTHKSPFAYVSKHCPRCLCLLDDVQLPGSWLFPARYHCSKCGYTGSLYLEKDLSAEQVKESEPSGA